VDTPLSDALLAALGDRDPDDPDDDPEDPCYSDAEMASHVLYWHLEMGKTDFKPEEMEALERILGSLVASAMLSDPTGADPCSICGADLSDTRHGDEHAWGGCPNASAQ
jgi:hypothetical protein